jgi:hypothetical protein
MNITTTAGDERRIAGPRRLRSAAAMAAVATAAAAAGAGLVPAPALAAAAGGGHPPAQLHRAARSDGGLTISGRVTDAGGHRGWPVYARVWLSGTSVVTFTNPVTGQYRLPVPHSGSYTVRADPITQGYEAVTARVTVGRASIIRNLADPVNRVTCTAPGYHEVVSLSEDFSQSTAPPGWKVVTTGYPGNSWVFNTAGGTPNYTGATGNYAMAFENQTADPTDTTLISPAVNLHAGPVPVLRFDEYADSTGSPREEVDLSIDGGKAWRDIWAVIGYQQTGQLVLPLPRAAGKSAVRVRFRYTDLEDSGGGISIWQVDDVTVADCEAASGGLLVGRVSDANTGRAVDAATVTSSDQPRQSAAAIATAGDPAIGGGLYWLFSGLTGSRPFTAAARDYATKTSDVTVRAGRVTVADFRLAAGRLTVTPASLTATARLGGRATASVTVRNTGTAPASVAISPTWPSGSAVLGTAAETGVRSAPLRRISGHFKPGIGLRGKHLPGAAHVTPAAAAPAPAAVAAGQGDGPWRTVASIPQAVNGGAAATDPATGQVYVVGGGAAAGDATAAGYVLDPATGRWQALPPMSHARGGAQAAFIGGRLYVTGGSDELQNPVPYTEIYDPALGRWSAGASVPYAYTGAATAVLDGKMYLVGGCDPDSGDCGESAAQVYDPATNQWSFAAPYPVPLAFMACGGIGGGLYCAGGGNDLYTTSAGYVYDPAANTWSPIPYLPIDLWGSDYAAANGQLLISGGVTDDSTVVTNQGYAYDPAAGAWSPLPNAPGPPVYEGSGACGFYDIGGTTASNGNSDGVAELPGYGGCGGPPWLSLTPSEFTLAPGQATTVTVTMNAATSLVSQPGTYTATLLVSSDTPYTAPTAAVTLTATPPATWGRLAGTVTGRACNGTTTALAGATVQISGRHGTWTPTTNTRGRYALWLDDDNSPATLIVSQPGWQPQAATATITPRATTTRNFTLAPAGGCG